MCACVRACGRAGMCVQMCAFVSAYVCACICACICACLFVHVCVCVHFVCVCVCIHMWKCVRDAGRGERGVDGERNGEGGKMCFIILTRALLRLERTINLLCH